jgi:hypothetical protein
MKVRSLWPTTVSSSSCFAAIFMRDLQKKTAGLLEIRGVGILEIPHTNKVRIALAVELVQKPARLPEHCHYVPPKLSLPTDSNPPLVRLCPYEPSATAKIGASVAAFAHKRFRESVKRE